MIVGMWMARSLITIEPEISITEAAAQMPARRVRRLPVTKSDKAGAQLVGIVSGTDLFRAFPNIARAILQTPKVYFFDTGRVAAARGSARLLQLRAALGEARLGKAQENQAEDRRRVLRRFEPEIRPELVRGGPQALFRRLVRSVFFGRCYPAH